MARRSADTAANGVQGGDGRRVRPALHSRRGRPGIPVRRFVNPDPVYPQSTGFLLDPSGYVVVCTAEPSDNSYRTT